MVVELTVPQSEGDTGGKYWGSSQLFSSYYEHLEEYHMWPRIHVILRGLKCKPTTSSCTPMSKIIVYSELGGKARLCQIIKMFPRWPPPTKDMLGSLDIFPLHIYSQPNFYRRISLISCIPEIILFRQAKLSRNIGSLWEICLVIWLFVVANGDLWSLCQP